MAPFARSADRRWSRRSSRVCAAVACASISDPRSPSSRDDPFCLRPQSTPGRTFTGCASRSTFPFPTSLPSADVETAAQNPRRSDDGGYARDLRRLARRRSARLPPRPMAVRPYAGRPEASDPGMHEPERGIETPERAPRQERLHDLTDHPIRVFDKMRLLPEVVRLLPNLRVAYRRIGEDEFQVLHPTGPYEFKIA